MSRLEVDEIWRELGKWGRYSKIKLGILLFGIVPTVFQIFSYVFIGFKPTQSCNAQWVNNTNFNGTNSSVNAYDWGGSGATGDSEKDFNTFARQWNLTCDNDGRAELSQTLLYVGMMVGGATITSLADKYGRKPVNIICHVLMMCMSIGTAFSPNIVIFTIFRFLVGVMQQGMFASGSSMMVEMVPKESRFMMEILGLLTWTTATIVLGGIGYMLQGYSWRYLSFIVSIVSIYSLFGYWLYDESIRWLLNNRKPQEAISLIKKAATQNNKDVFYIVEKIKILNTEAYKLKELKSSEKNEEPLDNHSKATYNITTLLRNPQLRLVSAILWSTLFVDNATYIGVIYSSSSISGDRFLNFLLLAIVEYPTALIEFILLLRLGRRQTCMAFHAIAGVFFVAASITRYFMDYMPELYSIQLVFYLIGKIGIRGAMSTIFLVTSEVYPTNLRNIGMGYALAVSRIGGMVAPFISPLANTLPWAPAAIFGTLCLLIIIFFSRLPETKGRELPSTVEEIEKWGIQSKP